MTSNQLEERIERLAAAAAHPLAELLECPEEAGQLLTCASLCIDVDAGEVVFARMEAAKGFTWWFRAILSARRNACRCA